MKKFRFNLEKVLNLRQHHEQEAKIELGKAVGVLAEIENKIKLNAVAHVESSRQRFSGLTADEGDSSVFGAFSMFTWNTYILRLEQEAERLVEAAAQAEIAVEEKRNLYIEASRELKVMEKLKEKRSAEHRKEIFAVQTRELDDLRRAKVWG